MSNQLWLKNPQEHPGTEPFCLVVFKVVLNQKKIPISEWKAHGATQATDSEILLYALLISTVLGERMAQKEFINECPYVHTHLPLALSISTQPIALLVSCLLCFN